MSNSNPFLDYKPPGRRPMRARVVKSDTDAPMKATALEKAERDRSVQMRLYREHRREELEMARHGRFGIDIHRLEKFLRGMSIDDGDALIDLVKISRLPNADLFTRLTTLRLVGDAIERLRIQNGLPPYDDSLPGEDPTVFEIIRAELGVP